MDAFDASDRGDAEPDPRRRSTSGPEGRLTAPFAGRRARVFDALGDHAAMVLPAAPEPRVGRDVELRYRVDPDLYYLTGYTEPEAVAVLCRAWEEAPFTLFVRPRDPERERWTGVRGGIEGALDRFEADAAYPNHELAGRLPSMLAGVETVYFRLGTGQDAVEDLIREILLRGRKLRARTGRGPRMLAEPGAILDDMRLVKDAHEIERMRRAAEITVEGFREAARSIHPGTGEWEVEAALEGAFRRRRALGFAFPSIVASADRATVLHYVSNAETLPADALVLLDAGARYGQYAADVSRTLPVSGSFGDVQRSLYDGVLAARDAAIAAVRPGARFDDVHRAAVRVLVRTLVEHGLLDGDADELAEDGDAYKPFFPHKVGHWLGLDVHDVGDYARYGESRRLEAGMVLTVEPGLYIPDAEHVAPAVESPEAAEPPETTESPDTPAAPGTSDDPGDADSAEAPRAGAAAGARDGGGPRAHPAWRPIPEALRGIGIRIEDDVLVTPDGHEVLTRGLPATADEVERMVGRTEPR